MQTRPTNLSRITIGRILEHVIFWLIAFGILTFYYGADKPNYLIPLRNNLFYLPIHMAYFYTLAYFIVPKYLYTKQYLKFSLVLIALIVITGLVTRVVDILFVDPYLFELQKRMDVMFQWDKMEGSFIQRMTKPYYFVNAVKGTNLIVWTGLSAKFFKMWFERRQAATEAELNFLKGQIHPHFLFNTLNNLYSLTLQKSPQSPYVVMGLSEILRYMLYEGSADQISLKRDVEIVESYIALEKVRYEERLDLNFSISGEIADLNIAPLLILPLVENAFKHGVSEHVGDAWINIDLTVKHSLMKLKISNSKPDVLPHDIKKHKGNIGLENVRKRLAILYPDAYELKLFNEDDMFVAILEIKLDKFVGIL